MGDVVNLEVYRLGKQIEEDIFKQLTTGTGSKVEWTDKGLDVFKELLEEAMKQFGCHGLDVSEVKVKKGESYVVVFKGPEGE